MNNGISHNLQSPPMQPGPPQPNPHPQTQPQFQQQGQGQKCYGVLNVQIPLAYQPTLVEPTELVQKLQRSSKEELVSSYQLLLRTLEDAVFRNQEFYKMVQSRDSDIKTLRNNDTYMKAQLGTIQQRNQELENQNQTLNSENAAFKSNAVTKATRDELFEINQDIAANNQKLIQKNEVLWSEAEYARADVAKHVADNQILGHNIIELNRKLAEANDKTTSVQNDCDKLTQKNQGLTANLDELKQKVEVKQVKNLEEKLLRAETLHKSVVEELNNTNSQITNLNFALGSSRDKVSSLMNECQALEKKVKTLEEEKKVLLDKQNALEEQVNNEKEVASAANIALKKKQDEVDSLEEQLNEEKVLSDRKSEIIGSVKRAMQNGGSDDNAQVVKQLRDQVGILQLEKEHLTKQLDSRLEDIRKLQSQLGETTIELNSQDEEMNGQRMNMEAQAATLDSPQGKRMKGEANDEDGRSQVLSYQQTEKRDNSDQLKRKRRENRLSR